MKKATLILIVIALLAFAAWKAYYYFYSAPKNLTTVDAIATLNATELVQAFEADSASANRKYLGKVVAVEGEIKSIETDGGVTIVLKTDNAASTVRCSMDSTQKTASSELKEGSLIKIKGNCSGYTADELLGADVILNRCVLVNTKN